MRAVASGASLWELFDGGSRATYTRTRSFEGAETARTLCVKSRPPAEAGAPKLHRTGALNRYLWRKTRMQFRKFGCFAHLRSMRVAFRSCSYPRCTKVLITAFGPFGFTWPREPCDGSEVSEQARKHV